MFYYKELRDNGLVKSIINGIEEIKSDKYIPITEEEYMAIRKEHNLPDLLGNYSKEN